jgi:hypothetical protein
MAAVRTLSATPVSIPYQILRNTLTEPWKSCWPKARQAIHNQCSNSVLYQRLSCVPPIPIQQSTLASSTYYLPGSYFRQHCLLSLKLICWWRITVWASEMKRESSSWSWLLADGLLEDESHAISDYLYIMMLDETYTQQGSLFCDYGR